MPHTVWSARVLMLLVGSTLIGACATTPRQEAAAPQVGAGHPETVQVMILGSYHFENPGLDVVTYEVADVLSPAKQAEIEAIVDGLSRFRPTKIAVEQIAGAQTRLDSLLRSYRAGTWQLPRGEEYQLGFRLARRFDLPGVFPIDHPGEFPFEAVMAYAAANDTSMLNWIQRNLAAIGEKSQRRQRELRIPEILRAINDPADIAEGHGLYMHLAGIGAADGYAGANLVSRWYERNIRIFANLHRIAEPGDRVIFIVGVGHAAILRELVRHAPGMELVEPNDYLPR